jgi:hypothetical protein
MSDAPSPRFSFIFAAAMLVIAAGWAWVWIMKTERVVIADPPTIVVESVVRVEESAGATGAAAESPDDDARRQLSLALARIPSLVVVDTAADQVVRGRIERLPDGAVQLEARRHDADSDELLAMLRTRGSTLTEAIDRMTAQVAMSLGLAVPR